MWKFLEIIPPTLWYTSSIFKAICDAIFEQFNPIYQLFLLVINNASPIEYSQFTDLIAKDRGITKLTNETDQSYLYRVRYAFKFLNQSFTKSGIEEIIKKIFPTHHINIRELYKENFILGDTEEKLGITTIINSSFQKYYFIIEIDELNEEEKVYLKEILEIYTPAHVGFQINNYNNTNDFLYSNKDGSC